MTEPIEEEIPQTEESLPSDEPVQQDVEPTQEETQTEEGLPEGTKERTRKRFEQLNEKLKESQKRSVFDEFRVAQPQAPTQQPVNPKNFVNENGEVDINGLNQAINQAQQAGQMSYQQTQFIMQQVQEIDRRIQERETYSKHQALDPKNEGYDVDFRDLVADRMARYWATGINKPLVEVADEVSRVYAKQQKETKVAKEAVEKYKETQERRQAEGPVEKGKGVARDETPVDELRQRMREGSGEERVSALAERLKRAGL